MQRLILALLTIIAFQNALAAHKVSFYNLEQIVNEGEIYNVQILYSSERNSKEESYVVAHYGAYYLGRCNGYGPCGCGSIGNVSVIRVNEKEKLNLVETKTVNNSCSNSDEERFSVKYNKEYIFLFSEKNENLKLEYVFNKKIPELGFTVPNSALKYFSNTSPELSISHVGDEPNHNNPGFNCKKASSYIEEQICSSSELSNLDKEMSNLYKKSMNKSNGIDGLKLKKSQIEFINSRVKLCADVVCIKELTSERIVELSK